MTQFFVLHFTPHKIIYFYCLLKLKMGNYLRPVNTQNTAEDNLDSAGLSMDNSSNISDIWTSQVPPTKWPKEMTFTDENLVSVVAYSVFFVIGATGNLAVLVTLIHSKQRKSRVNRFILHLAVADLIVTFIMMPLEIVWHITVSWNAGDATCRVLMFFRAFGLYLSSFILITISLDRYFAVTRPLSLADVSYRGKLMLFLAWIFSAVASIPQSIIFHVEQHPDFTWFSQCVTFHFFPTHGHELAYNLFSIVAVYGVPLIVIIVSYTLILCEISKKTRQGRKIPCDKERYKYRTGRQQIECLRMSSVGRIERARTRTLKMTIVIVLVFIICWTPYFVISAWWWFDKTSAEQINPKLQRGLFLLAVSNSCMNPVVYGMFTTVFRRATKQRWNWFMSFIPGTVQNRRRVVAF